ncbi:hypothetical protein MUS1_07225 [Marinomonas ushuaiensis DSM 15871]|uniref:Uncharacterized protein n=1 Tax=Marinomonas ushuaiensis DSM 15871 TaxID=1122207 RepID=X7E7B6_9GAMM|nr:hypothetical protein [Marinomonas ushuaiensis]ETX11934.1 hypothetical protein MUS1_07225 [Marinomonas ushuaiensis DSM 15871]
MNEIWTSLVSGAFAGAGVVAFLAKFFIENRLKRSLKKYQHDLDARKDTLQTELSLYVHKQNLSFSKYDEAQRDAVKNIYVAVISTSFPRNGFGRFKKTSKSTSSDDFCSLYFQNFSSSFNAFENVYQEISKAYAILEENSIYIEQNMENEVISTLEAVKKHYDQSHDILKRFHNESQLLFKQGTLNINSAPFNFEQFHQNSSSNWVITTTSFRIKLKKYIRKILSPE